MEKLGRFKKLLIDRPEWGELATFVPNKGVPVYNWFYYKEGFSAELVIKLMDMFNLRRDAVVLDPFCGSGTTLLACKQRSIESIGYDVLPISVFASYVKTREYHTEKLKIAAQDLLKKRFEKPKPGDAPAIMYRAFSKYALDDVFFFKQRIAEIADEDTKCFFLLALVKAALSVSYAWKDGAVIKIKKKHSPPLRFMLKRIIRKMIKDLEQTAHQKTPLVEQCDARRMNAADNSIDAIITSPPYLNQIDYTKVYAIEDFIVSGMRITAHPAVRSYIGLREEYNYLTTDVELPDSSKPYFTDMNAVLEEMYRVCKHGAKVAIVVGNGFLENQIVDSDLILAYLAEKFGFDVKNIFVLNKRYALANRTEKKGLLRESLIIMEKK